MVTRSWRIYGPDGHRQRESFGRSESYDWSANDDVRKVGVYREDATGTNDYAIIKITRNTSEECEDELLGQLSDGIFENSRVGKIEEIKAIG